MTKSATQLPIVPQKYAGKWIAWDHSSTRIIASGRTFDETRRAAQRKGEQQPVFEKVPLGLFVGGR